MNEVASLLEILPTPRVRKERWPFPFIWIIPFLAAVCAGYFVYDYYQELGPRITLKFRNVYGLKIGQAPLRCRGVVIGEATSMTLSDNFQSVIVEARLKRSTGFVPREGATFWIIRPEVGYENMTGLSSLVNGPWIEVSPGLGEPKSEFFGLESPPGDLDQSGSHFTVYARHLNSLRPNSPVYFRGLEVGRINDVKLSKDATNVDVDLFIRHPYATLVTVDSKFWKVAGANMSGSLFRSVEVKIESLRSLVNGGISFATPEEDYKHQRAPSGTKFVLYDEPQSEWLNWSPSIPLAVQPKSAILKEPSVANSAASSSAHTQVKKNFK